MPTPPQNAQKSILSMLLSAPSDLHIAWKSSNQADWAAELDQLNFSPAARTAALETMQQHKANIADFVRVATLVKDKPWAGGEPHPERATAIKLVADARAQDGE